MSRLSFADRYHPSIREQFEARNLDQHAELILMNSMILSGDRLVAVMSALDKMPSEGHTAEVGCAGGGTSILIGRINGGRTHWACDTFQGLQDTGEQDDLKDGDFGSSMCTSQIVSERFASCDNIRIVSGYFPDSAPQVMVSSHFAFVHIDVDTYKSTHAVFEFFRPRMMPGGFIALDDVIGRGTRGAKQAWQEIEKRKTKSWEVVSQNDPQVMVRFHG